MNARSIPRLLWGWVRPEGEVFLAFVSTRLLACALGWFAFYAVKHGEYQVLPSALPWNLLYHWDALWFGRIVQRGYDYAPGVQSSVNFFPLFPLLLRGFRWLTGAWTPFAGFVISNTLLLGAGVLLRRLASLDYPASTRIGLRAVWLLFLCPATFFHSAGYAESLYLFLSLGAFLLARQARWAGSAVAGALLTATRGNALLILLPLACEAVVQRRNSPNEKRTIWRSLWWLLLVPAGLMAYALFLHFRFGDALAFGHSQSAFYRTLAWPWSGFVPAALEPFPRGVLQIATALAGIFLSALCFRMRLRASYQIYANLMLLLALSSSYLSALPRLLSEIFPFYLALAAATIRAEGLYLFALAVSTALMTLCLVLFVCGYPLT